MTEVIYVFQRNEDLSVCALGMSFVHRERGEGFFIIIFKKGGTEGKRAGSVWNDRKQTVTCESTDLHGLHGHRSLTSNQMLTRSFM